MEHKKHILKSTGQIGGATLLSRVLGLIRDILCAAIFGTTTFFDAFVVAWTFPNLFRRFFGEGALTAAFVPIFTHSLIHDKREKSWHIARTVLTALVLVLAIIIIGITITLLILSQIFTLSEKWQLAFTLTYILLPYTIFICVTALFMGILNSLRHFLFPALAPAVLNIVWIGTVIISYPFFKNNLLLMIFCLSFAILGGGILQAAMQIPVLRTNGFHYRFSFDFKLPEFRKIILLMGPSIIGIAVFQINVVVDRLLAFFLRQGAATVLFFSNRLVQFPLAIFGISLATAVLPVMSHSISTADNEKFKETLIHGINLLLIILIPASVGLMILGIPIVELIFQRGAFTHQASIRTGLALGCYAIGLTAFALQKIIVQGFYARKDMITPVKIGAFCVLLNLILNLILMFPLKESGLALATSITSFVNVFILFRILSKEIEGLKISDSLRTLKKVVPVTIIMAFACSLSVFVLLKLFPGYSLSAKLARVLIPILASIFTVGISYHLIGLKEFKEIVELIINKLKRR